VSWDPGRGSEQRGRRPGLIVQADAGNSSERYRNTIVLAISTVQRPVPFHIQVEPTDRNGLSRASYVMCEQVMTVSKERLDGYVGVLDSETMSRIDVQLMSVLQLR
jgi:mRNA interferase MazF